MTAPPVSHEDYYRHVATAGDTGNYFTFRECYLDLLSRDAALVLQKMVNKLGYLIQTKPAQLKKDGWWFVLTVDQLERSLRMGKDSQARVLRELSGEDKQGKIREDRAFVKVRRTKTSPPRRLVWIDFLKLNKALDAVAATQDGDVSRCTVSSRFRDDYTSRNRDDSSYNELDTNVSSSKQDTKTQSPAGDGVRKARAPRLDGNTPSSQSGRAPSPYDLVCAGLLIKAVQSAGCITRAYSTREWAQHFRQLREVDGFTQERIDKVLTWYTARVKQPYVPHVYSAKSFRARVLDLESAMERWERDNPPPREVSTQAAELAQRLADQHHWPRGAAANLPQAVQESYHCYADLWARLDRLHKDVVGFVDYVMEQLSTPSAFLEEWWEGQARRVEGWAEWSGSFKSLMPRPGVKEFDALGRSWAEAWDGRPELWDELVVALEREG